MKERGSGIAGKVITTVFMLVSLILGSLMIQTKMIPPVMLTGMVIFLVIFVLLIGILTWNSHKRFRFVIGIFVAVIMSVIYILAGVYIHKTTSALYEISGVNTEVAQVGIYVKEEDVAGSINDTENYTYGILSELDRENSDKTLEKIKEETGKEVTVQEYRGLTELVDGLVRGETGAIVLNQAYQAILEEMEGYSNLESMIRQIDVENVETVIETNIPSESSTSKSDSIGNNENGDSGKEVAVQKVSSAKGEVFTIFVSGIDNRGGIVAKSRSDVNIIVTANTATRQLLLVSTPRDYYVPLSISNGVPDKLTHAGIYGISVCMNTLGMLYDMDINYYVRLNFDGFIDIIDALGGITIDSDYEFDSKNMEGYHFEKGENYVNGEQALAFVRERYAFKEGDRQRGKNQMAVIKGVVDRVLSPELLKNYSSILSSVKECFETNISYEEIARLLQQQLTDGGSWNVVSYSVDGTGDTQKPYSMSQKAYVMVPDYSTVDHAKKLMEKVRIGEIISQES